MREDSMKERRARLQRISAIIEIGNDGDLISRSYDIVSTLMVVANLLISIALTFARVRESCGAFLTTLEAFTYVFFAVEFGLRVVTAGANDVNMPKWKAVSKYVLSFMGVVDLLSFLPYFLPFFFPAGAVAFRMFRVARVFRLFRINVYYDSLNVIAEVIVNKKQQLLSSVFIIITLMVASSLCMYSLEHEAQPEVFQNAFSGIWWSVSTLLTVGYGDIYPITTLGKMFSIVITFLGVGMVAIPTGIISAGFVDQYSRAKQLTEYGAESDLRFIKVPLGEDDSWRGKMISELNLPEELLIAAVQRGNGVVVPKGNVVLEEGDVLVLGAEPLAEFQRVEIKQVALGEKNPWIGESLGDLDISRKTIISTIKRGAHRISPRGDVVLREGDEITLYTQRKQKKE